MLFERYFPVYSVVYIPREEIETKSTIIDLRDYNQSSKFSIPGSVNIPVAYLNRFSTDIPNRKLYIIASNNLERNVGIRLLRRKGFQVIGYTLAGHQSKLLKEDQLNIKNLTSVALI
ncbi:hypothetical protein [Robertmurraya sp. FSL R5-0851]|uniref:hypothetical protein n=1 Tax=Robertmurraya sp. FSL R5-0851 TaxID=2921584 RepID=UPI0030FA68F4